ncbi:unnamed protein product [Closterium sp. NIES-54]
MHSPMRQLSQGGAEGQHSWGEAERQHSWGEAERQHSRGEAERQHSRGEEEGQHSRGEAEGQHSRGEAEGQHSRGEAEGQPHDLLNECVRHLAAELARARRHERHHARVRPHLCRASPWRHLPALPGRPAAVLLSVC